MSKERSPFSPGNPVATELFIGREEQVKLLRRAIVQAKAGNPQYLFVTGERGIGKSSLAYLGKELADKEYGFIGAQVLLGGAESLGEVCRRLLQALISQLPDKNLLEKAKSIFDRYIERVDLFGLGVEFRKDTESRKSLAENFLPLMQRLKDEALRAGRHGIFLVADDLNGVAREANFASFLKSMVDQIAVTKMREFPWVFVLVGVPQRMEDLKEQQPSVDRIFSVIELPLLSAEEASGFFKRAFSSVNCRCQQDVLRALSIWAGGYPVIWHELGDAVFWEDDDDDISLSDAARGLSSAAHNVGRKYLKRPLYDELRSPVYRNILKHIARSSSPIRRSEILGNLPTKEGKNFDNFIRKMRELDVLRPSAGKKGEYVFSNMLFAMYVTLQAEAEGGSGVSR